MVIIKIEATNLELVLNCHESCAIRSSMSLVCVTAFEITDFDTIVNYEWVVALFFVTNSHDS